MAVHYKFKSAKDYDSIPMIGRFISLFDLKQTIYKSKHLERGTDFDLIVTNAQTNEEYLDEAMLIPANTSVVIRRVPGLRRAPIVIQPEKPKVETRVQDNQPAKCNVTAADSSGFLDYEASELDDEFGSSLYESTPEMILGQSRNSLQSSVPPSKADEDDKITALVGNSGLDWQNHHSDGIGTGRGFGRDGQGGRCFGRGGLEWKTPPQGYVCHRCKVPGHFIQHCPTNGDTNYDIKKVRHAIGIPKSMLVPTKDGCYALPSGTAAVMKLNEAAFDKEMEGLPSTHSLRDIPPELHCPLCKEVMRDAVFSSKCCFNSFCDKCIRDYLISKSVCVCGTRDILADYLLPNMTLRDTINRMLESSNSTVDTTSARSSLTSLEVQDMESARGPQPRIPSPTQSDVSIGEQTLPLDAKETLNVKENVDGSKPSESLQQQVQPQSLAEGKITKVRDVSEVTHEIVTANKLVSQSSALPVKGEVQQKMAAIEPGKKRKKKLPALKAADRQWISMPSGMDGHMGPSTLYPCWPGMQPAVDAFMGPFGGNMPYNMGMPMDMPFGNFIAPDPYGAQWLMMPQMLPPLQRDLAEEFGVNTRVKPQLSSKEESEARKAGTKRKREMEIRPKRSDLSRDNDYCRERSSDANASPVKSKPKPTSARRSPSKEVYEHYHDCDDDQKRRNKRAFLVSDRGDHYCHRSPDHARVADTKYPISKGKFEHQDLDHERKQSYLRFNHHSHSESSSSKARRLPLQAAGPMLSNNKYTKSVSSSEERAGLFRCLGA